MIVFVALMVALITRTFGPTAAAWVGAGLVGLGAAVLAGWAVLLDGPAEFGALERCGGDLLLVGLGVLFVAAGVPTFAAGVS